MLGLGFYRLKEVPVHNANIPCSSSNWLLLSNRDKSSTYAFLGICITSLSSLLLLWPVCSARLGLYTSFVLALLSSKTSVKKIQYYRKAVHREILPLRIAVACATWCHSGIYQSGKRRRSEHLYTKTVGCQIKA